MGVTPKVEVSGSFQLCGKDSSIEKPLYLFLIFVLNVHAQKDIVLSWGNLAVVSG